MKQVLYQRVLYLRIVAFSKLFACCILPTTIPAQELQRFGTPHGSLPLPRFGETRDDETLRRSFPQLATAVTEADRTQAANQHRKNDLNLDGRVSRAEWITASGQPVDKFHKKDLNGDGVVTLYEHTLRLVQFREAVEKLREQTRRSRERRTEVSLPTQQNTQTPVTVENLLDGERRRQIRLLAQAIERIYDLNGDGKIVRAEFVSPSSPDRNMSTADADRDGEINRDELVTWLSVRFTPLPTSRLSTELQVHDQDGDGQLSMPEFAGKRPRRPRIQEFNRLDRNQDGWLTADEATPPDDTTSTSWSNQQSLVLSAEAIVVSEIQVDRKIPLRDLDIRVRLLKEDDSSIQIHLIAPSGQRVTLFSGGWNPWAKGTLLENVLFDDDAATNTPGRALPPPRRAIQPAGLEKGEPGLSAFANSNAIGTWRLVVQNQNDQPGLLRGWSLEMAAQ